MQKKQFCYYVVAEGLLLINIIKNKFMTHKKIIQKLNGYFSGV